jgi:hypothetical protein
MSLLDALKSKFEERQRKGGDEPNSKRQENVRYHFQQALAGGDEHEITMAVHDLVQLELFDEALDAYKKLGEMFPRSRGEYQRWAAQTLYVSMAYRKSLHGEKVRCYTQALALYFQAAENGDREHENHVAELLELLQRETSMSAAKKRENLDSYLRLFPEGAHLEQVHRLRSEIGEG